MPNKKPLYAPMIASFGGGSGRGFGRGKGKSAALGLFNFNVGTSTTIRPMTFGSYGMSQSRWETVFNTVNPAWWSNRLPGVNTTDVLTYVTHPEEQARGNPEPGVIFGVTGFPEGTYRFTLRGGGGGQADPGFGAPGGLSQGDVTLTPDDVVYFTTGQGGMYVGGRNRAETNQDSWYVPCPGGWNGGGYNGDANPDACGYGGSGGGGTDIRLNGYAANTTTDNRILVAGGGGGATDQNFNTGGQGGGANQNGQGGGYDGSPSNAGQGGTLSSGGAGAITNSGQAPSGGLWFGGNGLRQGSTDNAQGGGGGGYYGGGGAADESTAGGAGGAGGGSGYADTSIVSNISATLGGANNGHCNFVWRSGAVDKAGRSACGYTLYDGSTFTPSVDASDSSRYNSYIADGTHTYINTRYGDNGSIAIQRVA